MSLRIVTDSTCDLSPETVDKYDLIVIPLTINIGGQAYHDGVDLSRSDFYRRLPTTTPHPTTAAPGPDQFQPVYEALAQQGASEILSIHPPGSLSATLNYARQAAQQIQTIPVTVFDSRQLSMGMGFVVQRAAQLAQEGQPLSDILPRLEALIDHIHLFAVLDTLDYVKRSGRMNWALAEIGTLLHIKPLLAFHAGQANIERIRTHTRSLARLVERMQKLGPLEEVVLLHTGASAQAEALRERVAPYLPKKPVATLEITPIIGAHLGPGGVGVACLQAGQ